MGRPRVLCSGEKDSLYIDILASEVRVANIRLHKKRKDAGQNQITEKTKSLRYVGTLRLDNDVHGVSQEYHPLVRLQNARLNE